MTKPKKINETSAIKDTVLFTLIHDFIKIYLPKLANRSPNTIYAYRESLDALLDFVKTENKVSLSDVTFEMIDRHMLAKFLDCLEGRGCSIETRNHRLNRIRAFYKYAAEMELTAVAHRSEILKVPLKKSRKPDIIRHMSEDAVKAILATPDALDMKGFRDQFFMILLYDTGARIQEIIDIRLCDIRLGQAPTVLLHGKRDKVRVVPLMESTINHFRRYLETFHPEENAYSEQPLFYGEHKGHKKKMHQDTARKFIYAYGITAREHCHDVPEKVTPHLWRHTRAMNLYQRGMDLTLISRWLGHASIETTRNYYAKADTEQKRLAIEKATDKSSPLAQVLNSERFIVNDDDILRRLYGLK